MTHPIRPLHTSVMDLRRPLPGGTALVVALCTYEVAALLTRSRQRTITAHVRRHPALGALILTALAHHWYVELP